MINLSNYCDKNLFRNIKKRKLSFSVPKSPKLLLIYIVKLVESRMPSALQKNMHPQWSKKFKEFTSNKVKHKNYNADK